MTDRPSLDDMTSDQLDQLYDAIDRVRAMHQPVGVVAAAEYGLPPDCAAGCGGDWPCATYTTLTEETGPTATEATDTWKEPTHPHPCTATIEGRATPGGRQVQCTREARHPENHVGPKQGANGRVLWTDWNAGAIPHKEQP